MSKIPRDSRFDSTLALLSEGYNFIPRRCQRLQSDIFQTRLMLKDAICMQGEEAARQFYAPDRFSRAGAMPLTTLMLLQDKESVQLQDGEAHRRRKRMFMDVMGEESLNDLGDLFAEEWYRALDRWAQEDEIVLNDELEDVLTRTACRWTGVPLAEDDVKARTRELSAMITNAGKVGPKNWWALLLRERTERWARELMANVRTGHTAVVSGRAAHVIAWHGYDSADTAAVELLNLLRPTVAVARYITFVAQALHEYPETRRKLETEEGYLEPFVQEVRRFYPFFPFIGGRVINEFDWRDHHFEQGTWVILDLYGTNHDPRLWSEPQAFRPERFREWDGSAYNFIPQGAGDHFQTHRCPGEWATIELMKRAVQLLVHRTRYDVPPQDRHIDLSQMPALPKSGFVMSDVQRAG